ncbi:MAG: hypothetical protein JXQ90_17255 [Cyclobacteriaceae bacterium]
MIRILLLSSLVLISCSTDNQNKVPLTVEPETSKYLRWVGDILPNDEIDEDFQLCYQEYHVKQYFNFNNGLVYEGEKKAIIKKFKDYQPIESNISGWIRIRFIVNCNGQIGRFRLISSDLNYQEVTFPDEITDQLMKITKSLDGWKVQPADNPKDYYQYLVFKIEQGTLTEILP